MLAAVNSGLTAGIGVSQNQFLVNMVVGVVLPALVALVTHKVAGANLKALILLLLTVLASVGSQAAVDGLHWKALGVSFATQFIAAISAHYGFLKPVGVTGSTGLIQNAVPGGLRGGHDPAATPVAVAKAPGVPADTSPTGEAPKVVDPATNP